VHSHLAVSYPSPHSFLEGNQKRENYYLLLPKLWHRDEKQSIKFHFGPKSQNIPNPVGSNIVNEFNLLGRTSIDIPNSPTFRNICLGIHHTSHLHRLPFHQIVAIGTK
jgi:hypothetical protein